MNDSKPSESQLKYFFSAYFTNFWVDMYPNWQAVVTDFAKNNPREIVQQAARELSDLIQKQHSEKKLRNIVARDLGANVYAPGMDMTYLQWLQAVTEELAAHTGKKSR